MGAAVVVAALVVERAVVRGTPGSVVPPVAEAATDEVTVDSLVAITKVSEVDEVETADIEVVAGSRSAPSCSGDPHAGTTPTTAIVSALALRIQIPRRTAEFALSCTALHTSPSRSPGNLRPLQAPPVPMA